jgi:hypothetical protein
MNRQRRLPKRLVVSVNPTDLKELAKRQKRRAKPLLLRPPSPKQQLCLETQQLIDRILAVEGVPNTPVYDSCPQLVKKIKEFLARPGMTKAAFLKALDDLNSNSLNRFLTGKGQDQCGNATYRLGYIFVEKLRILEGKPKSAARKKNELEKPMGFSLEKERAGKWFIVSR